jgi:3-methyladenine DNA glycosylase AlkD
MKRQKRLEAICADIRAVCTRLADPKLAGKYARFFREGYDAYGVPDKHPLWIEKKQAWFEDNEDLGLEGFLDLGDLLVRSGKYEEASVAIFLVLRLRDAFDERALGRLGRWFEGGFRNWAHTDVTCGEITGELLRRGQVRLAAFADWRSSEHKFKRRAVPVSMLALLKTDAKIEPLLDFIRPMMLDPERVVQQGLGWFLREAWKKQPAPVERFLAVWKDSAPRLIFQYATEKMEPAQRELFRKSKAKPAAAAP